MPAELEPGPTESTAVPRRPRIEAGPQRSWPWAPLCVFALALGVRGLYLAELAGSPLLEALVGDALLFDQWARRIAGGDWWGDEVFFQAPLYPYFMAVVYQLGGADPFHLRVVQALLGSLGCALLALAGRTLLSPAAGLAAGLILALYPPAIFFDGLVQKASLALFLSCALLALLGYQHAAALGTGRPEAVRAAIGALLLGMALGLLGLTRENALVLLPVLGAWLLLGFPSRPWKTRSAWLAAFGAGAALVLVPVGLRNLAVGGEFLITTSNLGSNFYIGNNAEAKGHYRPLRPRRGSFRHERADALELAREATGRELGPGAASRYWLGRSLRFARSQPGDWIALMGRKLAMVLNAREYMDTEAMEAYQDQSLLLDTGARWIHFGLLFPVAVLGAVLAAGRWRELWVLPLAFLAMALGIALFFVLARFRVPMLPMLALFAASGLTALPPALRARAFGRLLAAGVLAAAAALLSARPIHDDPDPRIATYQNIATFLSARGENARALELLDRAAAGDAVSLALRPIRARALARMGRGEEAVALYRDLLREQPGHWGTRAELAGTLADLGRLEEALQQSRAFLHAGREPLRRFAARSADFFGQVVDAERSAAKAHARQPENIEARLNLAVWLALREQSELALRECRAALEAAPDHPVGRSLLLDLQWWSSESGAPSASGEATSADRPNLVLISIDTLRADHLNSYGYRSRRTSPAIDALAADGLLFENHMAASPWTTPSHMSLFTGLHPTAHGLTQPFPEMMAGLEAERGFKRLGPRHRTLAELLADAGWATAAFTGGGTLDPRLGFGRGFGRYETDSYKLDDARMQELETWLRANSGAPFFLFWHSFEVHAPYLRTRFLEEVLPAERATALSRELAELRREALGDPEPGARDSLIRRAIRLLSAHGADNRQVAEALYDGGIAEFDHRIAELVALLRELDLYERTLIVVTSDHGEEFADHSSLIWDAHGHSLHEELIRIPLVLKLPGGLHAGRRIAALNSNVDLMPTLIRALGVAPVPDEAPFHGRPLQPLFDPEGDVEPRVAWSEALTTPMEQKSVRTETHRYIVSISAEDVQRHGRSHVPGRPAGRQLYDLRSDPGERENLMRKGVSPIAQSLDAILREHAAMPEGEVERVLLGTEALERLRSLGYVE